MLHAPFLSQYKSLVVYTTKLMIFFTLVPPTYWGYERLERCTPFWSQQPSLDKFQLHYKRCMPHPCSRLCSLQVLIRFPICSQSSQCVPRPSSLSLFSLPRTKNPNSPSSKLAQTAAATPQQLKVSKKKTLSGSTPNQCRLFVWMFLLLLL